MGLFHISTQPIATPGQATDDATLVVVSGELDCMATPRLRACLCERVDAGGLRLVLDLTDVTFIDSTAIGVIVATATKLRGESGALAVACAEDNGRVLRILDIVGVAELIALRHSRGDALRALARTEAPTSAAVPPWGASVPRKGTAARPTRKRRANRAASPTTARLYASDGSERAGAEHRIDQLA